MSGITGVFSRNENGRKFFDFARASVETLKHRGPDYSEIKSSEKYLFGLTCSAETNKEESFNDIYVSEDGQYTIVFDGRIFNYSEIRSELIKAGYNFTTENEAELILKSFVCFGKNCFSRFNGFFAIAIFDSVKEQLILARDRFGVKPLMYYSDATALIFASEMKAILQYPIQRTLDEQSVFEYFRLTYIPEPFSILKEVKKLEAAHYAIVTKDSIEINKFYSIENGLFQGSYQDACVHLRELTSDSIRLRLSANTSIGCFLSGGIDSSIISVLAARHNSDVHAFSISFPETSYFDESVYATEVAKMHGLKHTVIPVTESDFLSALPSVLDYIDEPFADSSAIAVNVLSSFVRKHVSVALSGDGADEIFGGYRKHRALAMIAGANKAKRLAFAAAAAIPDVFGRGNKFSDKIRQLRRMGIVASMSPGERYLFLACFHSDSEISDLLHLSHNYDMSRVQKLLNLSRHDDMNLVLQNDVKLVLPGDMFRKVDLMSMAASLEVRSPFLDYRIIDFAFSLPSNWKFASTYSKKIMTDSFADILPQSIIKRPKHGFEVPVGKWLNGALLENIRNEWLDDKFIKHQGLFYPEKIRILKNIIERGHGQRYQSLIWSIIVFQSWWKKFM